MKYSIKTFFPVVALFGILVALPRQSAATSSDENQFRLDLQNLTANTNRLAGRINGSRAAADYVEKRLREIGISEIYVQEFPVQQPRMRECVLICNNLEYPLYAVRPNLLQASITPPDGLTGKTVYLGKGSLENFKDCELKGRIAIIDFDCTADWLNAFAFGAKAVIFIDDPARHAQPVHHLSLPANLPRFYLPFAIANELALNSSPQMITIKAAAVWDELDGCNVIGVLRSANPIKNDNAREAILLAAPLDSFSEIPELAPGATGAGQVASLLHVAKTLSQSNLRRDVIFAFFDAEAQAHAGARVFYGSLYRNVGMRKLATYSLEERLQMAATEERIIRDTITVLEQPDLFSNAAIKMNGHREAVRKIRSVAFAKSGALLAQLSNLRMQLKRLENQLASNQTEEIVRRINELAGDETTVGLINELRVHDLAWNSVLRCIDEGRLPDGQRCEQLAVKLINEPDADRQAMLRERYRNELPACFAESINESLVSCRQRLSELTVRQERTNLSLALRKAFSAPNSKIIIHLSMNLGGDGNKWGFVHYNDYKSQIDDPEGLYTGVFKVMRDTLNELGNQLSEFESRSVEDMYPTTFFAPTLFTDSSAIARLFAVYNLSILTMFDPQTRRGLPADNLAALNINNYFEQTAEVALFLQKFVDMDGLGKEAPQRAEVRYDEEYWSGGKAFGHAVRNVASGDPMQAGIMAGALVAAIPTVGWEIFSSIYERSQSRGHEPAIIMRSQSNGNFELPPTSTQVGWPILATRFDTADRGLIRSITDQATFSTTLRRYVNIIDIQPMTFVGWGFDRLTPTMAMHALATARFGDNRHLVCEQDNVLALFAPPETIAAKIFNASGLVLLNNNVSATNYFGSGVVLSDPFRYTQTMSTTATDIFNLNDYRLKLLRGARIVTPSLETLHGRADDLRGDALQKKDDGIVKQSMLAASAAYSRSLYTPLVGVMKDLVSAVVILLLLALPFAFALERLLVGSPHIYSRLGWFAGFFLATFALMFHINPAFKLSATPAIIFLAFTVMLLSVMVIFIMMRKLRTEIKRMQGLSASAHSADVSRLSTMAAAVNMGISTMRRRPLRTFLTAVTVVLLTFTLLTFASFSSQWGNRRTYVGTLSDGVSRIMVRHPLWAALPHDLQAVLHGFLLKHATVVPRYWLSPTGRDVTEASISNQLLEWLLATEDGKNIAMLSAAIGLAPEDLSREPALKNCVNANARLDLLANDGVMVSQAVGTSLGLTDADIGHARLKMKGEMFTFAGCFDPGLDAQLQMDGSSFLPVDYKSSMGRNTDDSAVTLQQAEGASASFVPYPSDMVAIIPAEAAQRMGGKVRSITIYPAEQGDIESMAEDIAVISGLPTFMGSTAGVYRLFFSMLVKASGFRDLLVPILLGGLIIFATMLGSVVDREREIWTFSSLGLAPPHVAMLFFAESAIYAVVGGMGGYLLGQLTTHMLAFIGRIAHVTLPTMNFSSMNAVVTILIVMLIVMLSTLYPAIKASRSANAGVQRVWRMPTPKGNVIDILFPFTVSAYDLVGIVSYLEEHFQNFSDTSIGTFTTVSCQIFRQQQSDMLGFEASVALAPFDLGIEQRMTMLSQPSDVKDIHEVRVLLLCTGGAQGDWHRANRVFVGDLRRQFLLWRTLDEETTNVYREKTLARWNKLEIKTNENLIASETGKKAHEA